MSELVFYNSKFGLNVKHKQNNILSPLCLNCFCESQKSIYKDNNNYYIDIKIKDEFFDLICSYDKQCTKQLNNYINSLSKDVMKIKLPYRYKKIETIFKDNNDLYITSSDIKEKDSLYIVLICNSIWDFNNTHGMVWKTNLIKKLQN